MATPLNTETRNGFFAYPVVEVDDKPYLLVIGKSPATQENMRKGKHEASMIDLKTSGRVDARLFPIAVALYVQFTTQQRVPLTTQHMELISGGAKPDETVTDGLIREAVDEFAGVVLTAEQIRELPDVLQFTFLTNQFRNNGEVTIIGKGAVILLTSEQFQAIEENQEIGTVLPVAFDELLEWFLENYQTLRPSSQAVILALLANDDLFNFVANHQLVEKTISINSLTEYPAASSQ